MPVAGLPPTLCARRFVVTDGETIYGVADTPEEAEKAAGRFCAIHCLEPLHNIPRLHIYEEVCGALAMKRIIMARATYRAGEALKENPRLMWRIGPKGVICLDCEIPPSGKRRSDKKKFKAKG